MGLGTHDQRVEHITRFCIVMASLCLAGITIIGSLYAISRDSDLEKAMYSQQEIHDFMQTLITITENGTVEEEMLLQIQTKHPNCYLMIISPEGEWSDTNKKVFRHLTKAGDNSTFKSLFPEEWVMIFANISGQHVSPRGLFTYSQIEHADFAEQPTIVTFVPKKTLYRHTDQLLLTAILFTFFLFIFIGIVVWFFIYGCMKQIEAEKQIKNLNEVLQIINKILRHDVSNKLVGIRLAIETYEEDKNIEMLKTAQEITDCGIDLVRKMSKLEKLVTARDKLHKIDIRKTIDVLKKGYTMPIRIKGNVDIKANQLIESVLDNLIGNAIQHSGTKQIVIELSEDRDHSIIKVIDYGKGMPEDVIEFFKTCTSIKCTDLESLGLYIVKKSVEHYGGTIEIENSKPKGTTFIIKLPK